MQHPSPTLDYAPISRSRRTAQRLFYCIGFPLLAIGFVFGLGRGGDVLVGSAAAALGAISIAFALPVER